MYSTREEFIRFPGGPNLNYKVVITFVFMAVAAVLSTRFVSGLPDLTIAVVIAACLAVVLATFIDTTIGLILILLSMLLSPELEIGHTAGRAVVVRAEDLLLVLVALTWLAKMALKKELPFIRHSPLNAPIGIYAAVLMLSTLKGVLTGDVSPLKGMFYTLKLFEYLLLYLIVLNHTVNPKQVRIFFIVLAVTAFLVGLYANSTIGQVTRISAPFEGEAEPNTLGGYLLFVLSIIGGAILYNPNLRGYLIPLFVFLLPTFAFTLSRASYLGMIPALGTFVAVSKNRRVLAFILTLILLSMLLVAFGPPQIKERVIDAFRPEPQQELKKVVGVSLGPSPAARIQSWKNVLTRDLPRRPFFGKGVTGAGFLDSQYMLTLAETGVIGFLVFIWLLYRIWQAGIRTYNMVERPFFRGIALGYLAGFIGLLTHAIGSNTFIIIRIAEPFWFFTAIVVKLPDIETGKAVLEDKVPRRGKFRL